MRVQLHVMHDEVVEFSAADRHLKLTENIPIVHKFV